jgi:Zn-dependent peptidase ImmA (M78 family)/DNA-binding XRE family transcriptional regulator
MLDQQMRTKPHIAFVNPRILSWARKRSGLSHRQLQDLVKISSDDIAAWESGDTRPPFDKAQKLAQALHIPFGYLFLSEPPDLTVPLPDMRTLAERHPLSLNFLEVVNDALLKQDWYRDHLQEIKAPKLKFVNSFTANDGPDKVAADVRRVLGMNLALRRSAKDWGDYLSKLAGRSEDAGILVMRSGVVGNLTRRKLSSQEFQGFALSDPFAPVVFVNSEDFKAAQIFTLVHELAHIWIGKSAISHFDPTLPREPESSIELFCNYVSVEALVPRKEFEEQWNNSDVELLAGRLSRYFWVSSLVILRRAYELDKITKTEFFEHIEIERKKYRKQRASGGDYYRNVIARMGSQFTKAVVTEAREGNLLYRDAARLLRIRIPTLMKLSEQMK